jgi:serine/threonine protein kinase/tetratricopeptide (TPR) repeat protein
MEHQVAAGDFHGVERCVSEYPVLRSHSEALSLLAFEEYRLLNSSGVSVSPLEYQKKWQVDVENWNFEGDQYHLTEDDWRQASEREATSARLSSTVDPVRPPSTRPVRRRKAVLECGQVFGPFRILVELGSGALATVYLAEQLDLSERLVVLKVCSFATSEPQKIAQLQHPNIVQILSLHDVAGYQVLCMPYVGATTFADILAMQNGKVANSATSARTSIQLATTISMRQREVQTLIDDIVPVEGSATQIPQLDNSPWLERWQKLPFEEVVCQLLYQAASGLEHAHQHGLVHSDLKPANILLGDDGKARLVDFNVAQNTFATAHANSVGGTLPYMAPEHLQSLMKNVWSAGPTSDIYSLGVVAHQLLSGQLPFETVTGPLSFVIEQSVKQREQIRPTLSASQASPDLRTIIEKMLEPEIRHREDLRRHLDHQPLRFAANRSLVQRLHKWTKRHPKLSSATTIGSLAGVCVLAIALASWTLQSRLRGQLAKKQVAEFRSALPEVFVTASSRRAFPELAEPLADQVDELVNSLGGMQPNSDGCWQYLNVAERQRLAADLLTLVNAVEHDAANTSAANQLSAHSGSAAISQALSELANRIDPSVDKNQVRQSSLDQLAEVLQLLNAGHVADAIERLQRLLSVDSRQPAAWLLLGHCFVKNGKFALADQAYASSLALTPNQWRVWYCRALSKLEGAQITGRIEEFSEAADYFTRALELKPSLAEASYNRAICRQQLGDIQGALEDANKVVDEDRIKIPASLFCARQYLKLGQRELADDTLKRAYEATPRTANDFIELGISRMASEPNQAVKDLVEANRLRPATILVLQNLAYLTMEIVPDPKLAETVVNEWVAAAPQSAVAVASRAVYYGRQANSKLAIEDARVAIKLAPTARETAQIASVYALASRASDNPLEAKQFRDQAFKLLATALQQDWKLVAEVSRDPDLLTLNDDTRFKLMLGSAASLLQLPKLAQETKATSESKSKHNHDHNENSQANP